MRRKRVRDRSRVACGGVRGDGDTRGKTGAGGTTTTWFGYGSVGKSRSDGLISCFVSFNGAAQWFAGRRRGKEEEHAWKKFVEVRKEERVGQGTMGFFGGAGLGRGSLQAESLGRFRLMPFSLIRLPRLISSRSSGCDVMCTQSTSISHQDASRVNVIFELLRALYVRANSLADYDKRIIFEQRSRYQIIGDHDRRKSKRR